MNTLLILGTSLAHNSISIGPFVVIRATLAVVAGSKELIEYAAMLILKKVVKFRYAFMSSFSIFYTNYFASDSISTIIIILDNIYDYIITSSQLRC